MAVRLVVWFVLALLCMGCSAIMAAIDDFSAAWAGVRTVVAAQHSLGFLSEEQYAQLLGAFSRLEAGTSGALTWRSVLGFMAGFWALGHGCRLAWARWVDDAPPPRGGALSPAA